MFRRDRTTGKNREFDVGISFSEGHHKLVQAFEVRDRSRKIGVPEVEQFAQKCADCGVNRGVLVSARGFHKTAIAKARHLNIGCLTLEEAQSFNWLLAREFGFHHRLLTEAGFLLSTGASAIDDTCLDAEAFNAEGAPVSLEERNRVIQDVFNKAPIPSVDHEGVARARIRGCPWFRRDRDGTLHRVSKVFLEMKYRMSISKNALQLHFYRDETTGKLLQEIASVNVAAPGRELGPYGAYS